MHGEDTQGFIKYYSETLRYGTQTTQCIFTDSCTVWDEIITPKTTVITVYIWHFIIALTTIITANIQQAIPYKVINCFANIHRFL